MEFNVLDTIFLSFPPAPRNAEFQSKGQSMAWIRLFSSNYSMLIYITAVFKRLDQMQGPFRSFIECEVAYDVTSCVK